MIIKRFKNGRPVDPTTPRKSSSSQPIKKQSHTSSPSVTPVPEKKKGCGCGKKK